MGAWHDSGHSCSAIDLSRGLQRSWSLPGRGLHLSFWRLASILCKLLWKASVPFWPRGPTAQQAIHADEVRVLVILASRLRSILLSLMYGLVAKCAVYLI